MDNSKNNQKYQEMMTLICLFTSHQSKKLRFQNRDSPHLSALALATNILWQLAPIRDSNNQNENKTRRVIQNEGEKNISG